MNCGICGGKAESILDLGPQALHNRYQQKPGKAEYTHRFSLALCPACGLAQLDSPPPGSELQPRFPWIRYRDPDAHLDRVAEAVRRLPGVDPDARILGVGPAAVPLMERLVRRGFGGAHLADAFGTQNADIQDRLTPQAARGIEQGRVVAALHIVEHAQAPRRFLEGLLALTAPGGFLILEVPDTRRAFKELDYSALWEEHAVYFTPDSFRGTLTRAGLEVVSFETYPYMLEDSLVAIARACPHPDPLPRGEGGLADELTLVREFGARLGERKESIRAVLRGRRARGPIALFGAGHRSCGFVNFLDLGAEIDFVVDDDPNKRGLRMPGSGLPILGSAALEERRAALCLLGVSPESEEKVMAGLRAFEKRGGEFASIYPRSRVGAGLARGGA